MNRQTNLYRLTPDDKLKQQIVDFNAGLKGEDTVRKRCHELPKITDAIDEDEAIENIESCFPNEFAPGMTPDEFEDYLQQHISIEQINHFPISYFKEAIAKVVTDLDMQHFEEDAQKINEETTRDTFVEIWDDISNEIKDSFIECMFERYKEWEANL